MALAYKTPGVYIEEIPKFPPIVSAVETAIPAFIGYTEKSVDVPLNKPFRITSMVDYEQRFGMPQAEDKLTVAGVEIKDAGGVVTGQKFTAKLDAANRSKHTMYYNLQMYFANGGGPCYIVSAGPYKTPSSLVLTELQAGLKALEKVDEPTLIVFPEAQALGIDDFKTLMDGALAQCQLLKDRFVIMDVHGDATSVNDPASNMITIVDTFRDDGIGNNNLKYGAAYGPNLETVLDYLVDESKTDVSFFKAGVADSKKLDTLQAADNLVYESARAAIRDLALILAPASTIAGVYAATDAARGVWKAPANVSLNAVIRPTIEFTNRDQESINDDPVAGKSVNAIRPFTGKGTLVWGARTLAGNDAEWRYVNVRRLFIFIEESCGKAAASFVFEPNDANTWVKVQAMLENFLTVLWRQGALQGAKPDHAFYVAVGLGKTMTAQDLLEGRMIVEIGLAAVRPAEFIILRFSHKLAQS